MFKYVQKVPDIVLDQFSTLMLNICPSTDSSMNNFSETPEEQWQWIVSELVS